MIGKDQEPTIGKDTQFKPGESGNPDGLPKGTKHLKTLIQEIGNNIDWDKTTLKDKDKMKQMYGNNGWTALIYVAFTKALAGDAKAMEWLAKNGYGTNIDLTSNGENLPTIIIESIYGTEPNFRPSNEITETTGLAEDSSPEQSQIQDT